MDIRTLLGDAWKDGMTIEEINQALADKTYVETSALPKSVSKDTFDKTASELARLKRELAEMKTSTMTVEERLKQAQEEALSVKSTYQKELSKLRAREVFTKAGLGEGDYGSLLDSIVSDNEETTMGLANTLVSVISAQKALTEKTVREQLLKETPKPPAGDKQSLLPQDAERQKLEEQLTSAPKLEDRIKAALTLNPLPLEKG